MNIRPEITKACPLLGNSSPEIMRPIKIESGTLQVVWLPELDAHGLFFSHKAGVTVLATHNNGHSCHCLAERIQTGDLDRVVQQVEFIRNCGGMAIGKSFFESILAKYN